MSLQDDGGVLADYEISDSTQGMTEDTGRSVAIDNET